MRNKINISTFKNLYFIGIGGIGMSAIARYFLENNKNIAGYDKNETKLTLKLEKLGMQIHYKDEVNKIPKQFLDNKETLIIYTPAIPNNHKEFNYFKENKFTILKRAEILGLITNKTYCFAVAGTHGKTTTSAILGHILKESGIEATSFLGGIATNYNSNLILGKNKISVVEADEYDRSFLQLSPNIACITSTDADHLDVYKKANALEKSFQKFANKTSDKLFVKYGLPTFKNDSLHVKEFTFGLNENADYQAKNIKTKNGFSIFDIKTPTEIIKNIKFQMFGNHNILNALTAFSMAYSYGVSASKLKNAFVTFKGIQRRFNIKINTKKTVLIDDYAHHPTEINAVFNTVKQLYPNKEKVVIFQPHLYSRTRDFVAKFTKSLAQFDQIYLLNIYPARELPIKGITSNWLVEKTQKINAKTKLIRYNENEIIELINKQNNAVITMLGAGDIGKLIETISIRLEKNLKNTA